MKRRPAPFCRMETFKQHAAWEADLENRLRFARDLRLLSEEDRTFMLTRILPWINAYTKANPFAVEDEIMAAIVQSHLFPELLARARQNEAKWQAFSEAGR